MPVSDDWALAHRARMECFVRWATGWVGGLDIKNVTSLGRKELELVREVERYQLYLVGLTSMHSSGYGTKLMERGWTLVFTVVMSPPSEECCVGVLPSG